MHELKTANRSMFACYEKSHHPVDICRSKRRVVLLLFVLGCFLYPTFGSHLVDSVVNEMQPLLNVITDRGLVRYEQLFQNDSVLLGNIEAIKTKTGLKPVEEKRSADLAFYMNAYNMWSTYLSYQKLKQTNKKWPGNISRLARANYFIFTKITVANKKTNLYNLENNIIRKYGEPRIHFCINCSSMSCPPLPTFLFTEEQLEAQMEEVTTNFINSPKGVSKISDKKIEMNPIFQWYKKDFDSSEHGSLVGFINHYLKEKINDTTELSYFDYDWSINWQKD